MYLALKDEDGTVARDKLIPAIEEYGIRRRQRKVHHIREIFFHYSNNGEMDGQSVIQVLRDAKLLNKLKFSTADAMLAFESILDAQFVVAKKIPGRRLNRLGTISCHTMLTAMVPLVARKLGRDENYVINMLQRIDIPESHTTDVSITPQHSESVDATEKSPEGDPTAFADMVVTMEKWKAAVIIQTKYRQMQAVDRCRAIKDSEVIDLYKCLLCAY